MGDPMCQRVGLSGTRASDDEERRTRCGVFLPHTMLDSSSLLAIEAFKISYGHWWQIGAAALPLLNHDSCFVRKRLSNSRAGIEG
jgi:hypothetical protein